MDKNILSAIIGLDETEALVVIEPFHYPGNRNRSGRIRARRCGRGESPNPRDGGARSAAPEVSTSRTLVTWAPLTPLLTLTFNFAPGALTHIPPLEVHRYVRTRRRIHCLTQRSRNLYRP